MKSMFAILMVSTFVLAGCNTVRGVGQDIEKAGEAVKNAGSR
jgi:predicted small secreted protein